MKKIIILVLTCLFLLSSVNVYAADNKSIVVQAQNSLPVPITKVVTFTVQQPNAGSNFKLYYKGKELPVQILKRDSSSITLRTELNFLPNETKLLVVKFGDNLKPETKVFFKPDFSGTYFVGIGSGKLYISSLADNNNISVKFFNSDELLSFVLQKNGVKTIPIPGRDTTFSITSQYPILAEVSSLKQNCLANSSDDVSSVYGTYFVLYIPREIVISAYEPTNVKISSLLYGGVFNGLLPAKGQYKNLNLKPDFYIISSDKPVTVQFGCEDDNIYSLNYGTSDRFKGVSYGNVVCSALFPQTKVKIKTPTKTYPEVTLEKSGDYIYEDLITKFADNSSELLPVYIEYSKPILIYSDANHGNIGGEQIPSLNGYCKNFVFHTGKIFNFSGLVHKRKVAVIASQPDTHIVINGKSVPMDKPLVPKYFLFDKSYSLVRISSDKPISVFDIGMTTELEFFTTLLPLKDNSVTCGVATSNSPSTTPAKPRQNVSAPQNFLTPIGAFFKSIFNKMQNVTFFKKAGENLKELSNNLSPHLKNLSRQIINLFMPAANMVYPYVHQYFPSLTQSELAAIIFYILIAFIIILIIPKRRKKKNIPVVQVKEEELKKRNVAFNVKTVEEKGGTKIKYGAEGKPKTLKPVNPPAKESQIIETKKTIPYPSKPAGSKVAFKQGTSTPSIKKKETVSRETPKGRTAPLNPISKNVERKTEGQNLETNPIKEIASEPEKVQIPVENKEAVKKVLEGKASKEEAVPQEKKPLEKPVDSKHGRKVLSFLSHRKETEEKKKEIGEQSGEKAKTAPEQKQQQHSVGPEVKNRQPSKEAEKLPKTSLDELLAKLKEGTTTTSVTNNASEVSQVVEKEKLKEVEHEKEILKEIASSVVMDKVSIEKIVRNGLIKHFIRTFISAKDQPNIDPEEKIKYRIGVISLTPIELRIAEDLSMRIGAKKSTGEALLIAKKVGVKQVIVDDTPKITNYQGIKIININDIIKD